MRQYGHSRPVTVPRAATPLVRRLFALMHEEQIGYQDLADRSGISHGTICNWRRRNVPSILALNAALNVLGYELAVQPIADETDCQPAVMPAARAPASSPRPP